MSFVHLHVHTHYSLLDSTIRIGALAKRAKELGMPAVAVTDHDNMFGAVEFFKAAKKEGVKPIIGCEVHVSSVEPDADKRTFGLVLLAETDEGYRNLCRIVSAGWKEGRPTAADRPRVPLEALGRLSEGVICLSGGLVGELAHALLRKDNARAERIVAWYRERFADRYYIEVQPPILAEHELLLQGYRALCEGSGVSPVATVDTHYLTQDDAEYQKVLMCMQLTRSVSDTEALARIPNDFYLWTADEMRAAFSDWPEAVHNAVVIAERINAKIELGKVFLPNFQMPEGFVSQGAYLRHISHERLSVRIEKLRALGQTIDEDAYRTRLNFELDVIEQMGFPGYFLIVWDFINWGKENGVPVGPGRGSGAGSLVAYAVGITDIDPIRYDLLFERFLNPERVSMPDFDIDFCMNRRDRVIDYVTRKYGKDNVGQIVTYGTLKARGVIRDVARVMDLSFGDADKVAKLVPEVLNITLDEALAQEPRLGELIASEPTYAKLFETARRLENLNRHTGVHAAGIVIGEEPLENYVPVATGDQGELITQYAKNEVEEAGLVKFDFLGLKTLTVIEEAVRLIREGGRTDFDISAIPMDDGRTFKLLQTGNTTGIFQLESSGFQDLMRRLKPDKFEDVIAAVALYRPGPLQSGMVDSFIRRKHGQEPVDYLHPALKDVLAETYGTIIYQEQVMRLASILAGFSLGQADILRRAMGKKKADVMAEQRAVFVTGCSERGTSEEVSGRIFDLVQEFASYGFNKSHSAAYGLITYQTAFLKAHYPTELMAALLTCDKDNTAKVVRYISEARSIGVAIQPPDVNLSALDFSVTGGAIRFGLGGIKNVGESAISAILEAREAGGAFKSVFDFSERVDLRRVNKRVLEGLTKCGAFDSFGESRDVIYANIDRAIERGQSKARDRASGQMSLFGALMGGGPAAPEAPETYRPLGEGEEWSERQRLSFERETLGFYITGHPLDRFRDELKRLGALTTAAIESADGDNQIAVGGVVAALRERPLKDGSGRMGFAQLEDTEGAVEVVIFSSVYEHAEVLLKGEEPILVKGRLRIDRDGESSSRTLRAEEVISLAELRKRTTTRLQVRLPAERADDATLRQLQDVFRRNEGPCAVAFNLVFPDQTEALINCADHWRVGANDELIARIERLAGKHAVRLL